MDRLTPSACRLWWLRTAEVDQGRADHLLSDEDRARRAGLLRGPDRLRYTAARALTRAVLARHLGIPAAQLRIDRTCRRCGGPHGKPRAPDAGPGIDFSLSHDGGLVVLVLSTGGPVGVDTEQLRPRSLPPELAARVLHPSELRRSGPRPGLRTLLTYWTRKESLTKATGEGVTAGFDRIEVSAPGEPPALLRWDGHDHRVARASMAELTLPGGYLTAVSSLGQAIDALNVQDAAPLLPDTV